MDEAEFIGLMQETVWVGIAVSTPILVVALVVGLAVGLIQALTSIQEMTLTFVPKLIAILVVFWFSMGFMSQGVVGLYQNRLIPLIAGG